MTNITFEQLNLAEFINKAITDLGFENPSAIQAESIPHLMENKDVIAMAPTGSGKTFAFAIPALQKINVEEKDVQVLVLCPTRELTIQAHREFEKLSKYNEEINIVSIYGGQQIGKQVQALKRNPQVIIATPGRLMDHLRQENISLRKIKYVVLDEADEMLDMGFREDINTILEQTNEERQTVLFSATMEKEIKKIAERFQKSPMLIDVMDNLQSAPNIEQFYLEVSEKDKPELITRLLDLHSLSSVLIFCNTKSSVDKLVDTLKTRSFLSDAIHGDMNQSQREKVMSSFKRGSVKILVATDVAGRGIDVKNIGAVFNYDLPRDDEDYIHRIGRTGRAGNEGKAFSLVTKNQVNVLKKIERANGLKINKTERPTVEEIESARFEKRSKDVLEIALNSDLTKFKEAVQQITSTGVSELDVAAALYKILNQKEQVKIDRQAVFEETCFDYSDKPKSGRGGFSRSRGRRNDFDRKRSRTETPFGAPKFFGKKQKSRKAFAV